MLWPLLKIVIFIVIVAALTFGVQQLTASDQDVRIAFANTEFNLGVFQLVVAILLLLFAIWLILKVAGFLVALVRFVAGDETAVSRYFTRSREERGYRALSEGLTALAGGDGDEALSKASRAERLLKRPDLTDLVRAQAAEMSGDRSSATDVYKRLLKNDRTRFVGVRGLMKQKLAEGDTETALKLAEKAYVLKPRHAETSDTLLQLQAKHANWKGARKTLKAKARYGNIPKDLHKRRDAVLAVSEAQYRLASGDAEGARDEAIEAYRLAPSLVPAAVMAARAYIELDKPRNAAKTLRSVWADHPHPDLAAAFAEIRPNETPAERVKRFDELLKQNPDHEESRMVATELNIAAEDFPAARKALGDLPQTDPTARSLTLMAAIERGQGADDTTVKAWLAKALTASRGNQWVCDRCGQLHRSWTAVCSSCDGFDTLSWRRAPDGEGLIGTSAGMLPLIVGALEDRVSESEGEVVEPQGDAVDTDKAAAAEVIVTSPPRQEAAAPAAGGSRSDRGDPVAPAQTVEAEPAEVGADTTTARRETGAETAAERQRDGTDGGTDLDEAVAEALDDPAEEDTAPEERAAGGASGTMPADDVAAGPAVEAEPAARHGSDGHAHRADPDDIATGSAHADAGAPDDVGTRSGAAGEAEDADSDREPQRARAAP